MRKGSFLNLRCFLLFGKFVCVEEASILEGTVERRAGGTGPMGGARSGLWLAQWDRLAHRSWTHSTHCQPSLGVACVTPISDCSSPHEASSATCTVGRVKMLQAECCCAWGSTHCDDVAWLFCHVLQGIISWWTNILLPSLESPWEMMVWCIIVSEFINYSVLRNCSLNTLLT